MNIKKYWGSEELNLEKLKELGWNIDHDIISNTFCKDNFLLTRWTKIGEGTYEKVTLRIKDNINGEYLNRSFKDKYRVIFEGENLSLKQLNQLTK